MADHEHGDRNPKAAQDSFGARPLTEAERAAYHKKCLDDALNRIVEVMDAAQDDGFALNFNIGKTVTGKNAVVARTVAKLY